MAMVTGWYKNSKGKRVYGRHNSSPGYYNKAGKYVVGKKKPTKKPHSHPKPDPSKPPSTTPSTSAPTRPKSTNPTAHGLFRASASRLRDGDGYARNSDPTKARQLNFNLSNNEDLAQGSEHEWANPTSISNLISGQLRQAANAPLDAWETWAANNGLSASVNSGSSGFQVNLNVDGQQQQQEVNAGSYLANSQPMGAFGTSNVMNQYGMLSEDQSGQQEQAAKGTFGGWGDPLNNATGTVPLTSAMDEQEWKASSIFGTVTSRADTAAAKALATYNTEVAGVAPGSPAHTAASKKYWVAVSASRAAYKSSYAEWFNDTSPENAKVMNTSGNMTTSYKAAYSRKLATDRKAREAQAAADKKAAADKAAADAAARAAEDKRIKDHAAAVEARRTSAELNLKNLDSFGVPIQKDLLGDDSYSSNLYNPWGRMEGASQNQYGPSEATMGKATMEAMAMANAYFAPQRAELAYELGDMETDMRRLAVNLGRQVDDPVLQAKLYKEGLRSVRTLDIQQNTFAFQLADSRRKEENQNFQFYDQLAQEEARLKLANRQFYEGLDLQKNQYNLNQWAAANPAIQPLSTQGQQEQQQYQERGLLAKRGKLT